MFRGHGTHFLVGESAARKPQARQPRSGCDSSLRGFPDTLGDTPTKTNMALEHGAPLEEEIGTFLGFPTFWRFLVSFLGEMSFFEVPERQDGRVEKK